MIVIRWAAIAVFALCMVLGASGARDWALAGVAFVAFLVVCWTVRGRRPHAHALRDRPMPDPIEDLTTALAQADVVAYRYTDPATGRTYHLDPQLVSIAVHPKTTAGGTPSARPNPQTRGPRRLNT